MSAAMSNLNTQTDNAVIQWVTFKLGEEVYGINVMQVQEVIRLTEIAPVPGAPNYVMGIVNLRGNVVTVIDILVDSVAEVVNIHTSDIETSPNLGEDNESSKYIQGVFSRDDEILILIDINKLLSEQELEAAVGF
ncbi:MAG: chemotaxis protein CheW [Pseudomonadota bacterium]